MDIIRNLKTGYAQNKSEIWTGFGIGGFFVSAFFFVKNTLTVARKIDKRKEELDVDKLPANELVKLCWRDYAFPTAIAFVSAAAIIKSDQMKAKETGELMSSLMVSRALLGDYKEAVKEVVDEKKAEEIEKKADDKAISSIASTGDVFPTGNGNVLFVENLTGTAFRSSYKAVESALSACSISISKDPINPYISVNEVRYELDLPGVAVGEILGFNQSTGFEYRIYGGDYMGELCWYIDFYVEPVSDYTNIY